MNKLQKEYKSIILSAAHLSMPNLQQEDYFEEKFPIKQTTQQVSIHQDSIKNNKFSTIESEKLLLSKNTRQIVFPNILQKTKENMKKFRFEQLKLIHQDDPSYFESLNQLDNPKIAHRNKNKSTKKHHFSSPTHQLPIRTDLTALAIDSNYDISFLDSTMKFKKLNSNFQDAQWQVNNMVNRINLAHEVQKEMHHLERFKTYWKADMINQYLQLKIVQKGLNFKKGIRQIFILINLPYQTITLRSSQTEVKSSPTATQLNAFVYFIPLYEKVNNTAELLENIVDWSKYFIDLLHYKQYLQSVKYYFLDGKEITTLNQIPSYEKMIYCNLLGTFDFWDYLAQYLNLPGQFCLDKYANLATKLMDLRFKDDILKYFNKRENFLPYYQLQKDDKQESKQEVSELRMSDKLDQQDDYQLVNEDIFDQSIFQMSQKEQSGYLKVIQSFISQNKTKYSTKLQNLEEGMKLRKQTIKGLRRKSIENKLKAQKKLVTLEEQAHIERKIMYQEVQSIQEIKEDALDHVDVFQKAIYKKQQKLLESISDPFSSFQSKDNQKFKEIIKLVNVESIVLSKKISRQDVLHYLSLFKALMDSDDKQQFNKEIEYPTLYISIEQLRKSLPYIVLYKNQVNPAKLNEIYERKYNYVEFMEFLDIFTTNYVVSEKEMQNLDNSMNVKLKN